MNWVLKNFLRTYVVEDIKKYLDAFYSIRSDIVHNGIISDKNCDKIAKIIKIDKEDKYDSYYGSRGPSQTLPYGLRKTLKKL